MGLHLYFSWKDNSQWTKHNQGQTGAPLTKKMSKSFNVAVEDFEGITTKTETTKDRLPSFAALELNIELKENIERKHLDTHNEVLTSLTIIQYLNT